MRITHWFGLFAAATLPFVAATAQTPEAPAPGAPEPPPAAAPANLSPGAAEVVRLAGSGVGDDVVLAYINNSQAPFNLSADAVLYLKDLGLSPQVTSAMLTHDSSLRGQPQQYAPAATAPIQPPATAPGSVPPSAPPPEAAAPAPTYVGSPPPDVTYFYNSLSPYGTWVYLEGYGWCWQPRATVLTPGWRPYCDGGYWVYSDAGWYWQSNYSWGWAPFHYGRWQMHPHCGWVWLPDRVWGPAWVTWRQGGDACGWAPLPPHAEFDIRLGWRYNGVTVGASFGFGLGASAFAFVSFGDFCSHDLHRSCLPPARVTTVYHQTTIVNNYVVNNNVVVHRGIPVERVSAISRVPVPRATVHDWRAAPNQMPTRAGSVVYRPQLRESGRPTQMVAQRVDNSHPAIVHAPVAVSRDTRALERSSVVNRGGSASNAAQRHPVVESPKTSPAWSGSKPMPSQREQQPPAARQTAPGMETPKALPRSSDSPNHSALPGQGAPRMSQAAPTTPASPSASRAPQDWKQGGRSASGYRPDAGSSAR